MRAEAFSFIMEYVDVFAESAAEFADSARAAIAFIRAVRDERHDDLGIIMHSEAIVQHVTPEDAGVLIALLLIAAGVAERA